MNTLNATISGQLLLEVFFSPLVENREVNSHRILPWDSLDARYDDSFQTIQMRLAKYLMFRYLLILRNSMQMLHHKSQLSYCWRLKLYQHSTFNTDHSHGFLHTLSMEFSVILWSHISFISLLPVILAKLNND